ncbi:ATP-binding cassette domain-containing protein [Burkholderia pseudomallei]
MTAWLKRWRCLPADTRRSLVRGVGWAVAAALLDGLCGVLLVPLIRAWFAGGALLHWAAALIALTLGHALVLYAAQLGGYRAGGALALGLVDRLVRHLPRIAAPQTVRDSDPEGLLRGPVMQAMGIPAHLLGPLIGAVVTPLAVVAGLAAIDWRIALCLAAAAALLFALQRALDERHRRARALMRRSLPLELGFAGAVQAVFVAMLVGGAAAVAAGRLDPATVVAVLVLLVRFIEPLAQLTQLDQALRGGWRALDAVLTVLHAPRFESPERGLRPQDASVAAVRVGYRSETGATLLDDVDLHCPAGGFVAIVGPTGAGKSTLLGLLARLDDPSSGRVLFGNVDLRRLSETTLAGARTVVFQHSGLFRGSLGWNLRMGRPDASGAALDAVLDALGLSRDVERLPHGLDTDVGPGGQLLSGGQRQRACIARGLLAKAPLLLLDEPTASLDELSARRVRDCLVAMRGQRTRIVVTHHPALARAADEIVVLEAGRVRARGTHAQLVAADPWYAEFARAESECEREPEVETPVTATAGISAPARGADAGHR